MFQVIKKLLLTFCIVFVSYAQAQGVGKFEKLFVLGDSLSDSGNLASTGFAPFLAGAPYKGGRFSNGPVAVELLAENLGLELKPSLHLIGGSNGTNFAVGDAEAGGQGPIDLTAQLGAVLAANPGGFSVNDLFIVFFGGNDLLSTRQLSNREAFRTLFEAVAKIELAVQILIAAGAQNVIIVNAPDIGKIPLIQLLSAADPNLPERMTLRSRVFNLFLNRTIGRLKSNNQARIVKFNLFSLFGFLVRNGEDLGYDNSEDACFIQQTLPPFGQQFRPDCDFDEFLFFDAIHPTAVTHTRAASALQSVLPLPDMSNTE